MFMACGLSDYLTGMFHLVNHAFFKALLFLCAGAVIHSSLNEQDIRKIPVSFEKTPLVSTALDVGLLCLISFPFFGGFYSKDVILEVGYSAFGAASVAYYVGLLTALLTAGYASMIAQAVGEDEFYSSKLIHFNRHDSDLYTSLSLLILISLSLLSGFYLQFFFDFTSDFFFDAIYAQGNSHFYNTARDYVPMYVQLIPVFAVLMWLFFSLSDTSNLRTTKSVVLTDFFFNIERLLVGKFYVDNFFFSLVMLARSFSLSLVEAANSGFLEFFGPKGL